MGKDGGDGVHRGAGWGGSAALGLKRIPWAHSLFTMRESNTGHPV